MQTYFNQSHRAAIWFIPVLLVLTLFWSAVTWAKTAAYETIEWTSLIPEDDLQALLNPPDFINDIVDGSEQDVVNDSTFEKLGSDSDKRYQEALSSTRTIAEFNGKKVRIPGFIVPLEYAEDRLVKEFFLVPYFGACLHLPPPPPNQIIYVKDEQGFPLEMLSDAFWLEGTLITQTNDRDLGSSAYTLQMDSLSLYEEE